MLKNKRKNRSAKRKYFIKLFIYTSFCLFIAGAGIFLYVIQASRPLYISPLPYNAVLSSVSGEDNDISLIKAFLDKISFEYESVYKSNDGYVIKTKNKSEIILSANKDLKSQLSPLQFILTRLKMEGRVFNHLDLRFDKPVIRFK